MKSRILLLLMACTISGLTYSKSSLREKLTTKKNVELSSTIAMLLPPIPWTKVENDDPLWVYGPGGFVSDACISCSGGSAHSTDVENATAEYTFTGTDLELYAETYDGAGSVEIFIDGLSKGKFIQDALPHTGGTKFATITGLTNTSHLLKVMLVPEEGTNPPYVFFAGIDYIRFGTAIPGSVTGVVLNKESTSIVFPNTEQLTAVVTPADAIDKSLLWTSDNPTVATVDANGLVTSVGAGVANITATSVDDPSRKDVCLVTVSILDSSTKIDNLDPGWLYSGFNQDNCASCFQSTAHYSNVAGSTAEYGFSGNIVKVYAERFDVAGAVEIFIDNVSQGIFQQNTQPYGGGSLIAEFPGLSSAPHTIKLVTNSANFTNVDYISYETILPLTLISFNGKVTGSYNTLNWKTTDEVKVKHFELERSSDAITFSPVTVVNSKGGGIYSAIDKAPLNGNNYYRLKIIDQDGSFENSKVIVVKDPLKEGLKFSIYPNPVKDMVTISPSDKNSMVKVTIFDLQGRKVLTKEILGKTQLSLETLAKGVYLIQLRKNGEVNSLKLVKE